MHGPRGGVEDLGERPAELEVEHTVGDVREEKGVLAGGREGGGEGGGTSKGGGGVRTKRRRRRDRKKSKGVT